MFFRILNFLLYELLFNHPLYVMKKSSFLLQRKRKKIIFCCLSVEFYSDSASRSHSDTEASLGMRQSPRGERLIEPTFGPSGRAERLNCWLKNGGEKRSAIS